MACVYLARSPYSNITHRPFSDVFREIQIEIENLFIHEQVVNRESNLIRESEKKYSTTHESIVPSARNARIMAVCKFENAREKQRE
jgi:hypothetical protein